jgi:predicted CoA-substrate-specific enzyme activase
MIYAGVDAGSRTIKIVLLDAKTGKVIAKRVTDQGVEQNKLALELFRSVIKDNGVDKADIRTTVATGYGRNIVSFADTTVTEITCQAVGVRHVSPDAMTVIDIGGQDSKLVRLDSTGRVRDFAVNDRCAAGTGRFMEVVAERLDVDLGSLGRIAAASEQPASISNMCVVFAETEIVGLLAAGNLKEDIVAGVQAAIASRIMAMAGRNIDPPIVFTGGVAMVSGMDVALQRALKQSVTVSPEPQITAALGAAILASEQPG